ncbi:MULTISPECIES: helix-turn-helix domain-containing protein [Mycolicibacterium]|uniref:Helix-turn-helix transcriptional regulator n=2 Tax=Mycolicibacterium TaxID=1866885 RepID=A0AAE4VBZ9_MYCFO|nr:helix-turn-helix transcriptional regulator [Mycolicibacterium fortuitum]OCB46654.1 hypothetical protein A5721_10700 [Mycolicibacterium vulneris]MDV7192647.1 helix-turn-helix transcriptional regulator [Mycolicibacterium fortuitum]MDV7205548.1 helix-turn-helix transcriptional regulator [Mycolicibacterium fortuitum]MDV7227129.1 helix-turn-helix transcriptional regulator [Mycolicibacterium fortuitum]MDV7259626.1 helix-turn-helix transcriptional regulator [Mycolicibacterium fortuitum]
MTLQIPAGASTPAEVVAAEVRAGMARKRLTQVVLAERAGMATSTLSRRLTGESDFTVGELYRIADVLGVPAAALLANVEKASA